MLDRNIIFIIISFAFMVAVFFEAEYRRTGQLSGTSQIIDMGGLSDLQEPAQEIKKSRQYSFELVNNDFNPLIDPVRNQIGQARYNTFEHWENNVRALLNLRGDIQNQALAIQKVVEYDVERVLDRFPEIERVLRDQRDLFAQLLANGQFSEEGQREYILGRLRNMLNTDPNRLIDNNQSFQHGLQNLMENRALLEESIALGYEAINKQLASFNLVKKQDLSGQIRRHYMEIIEKRQNVLIENLKLSYEQLDMYQKAIDEYIEKIVKLYQTGHAS